MATYSQNLIDEEAGYLSFKGLAKVVSAFPGVWRSEAVWTDLAKEAVNTAKERIPNWAGLVNGTAEPAHLTLLDKIEAENEGFMRRARARMNSFPWKYPVTSGNVPNEYPRYMNGELCVPDDIAQAFAILTLYYAAQARQEANPELGINLGGASGGVATFGFDAVTPTGSQVDYNTGAIRRKTTSETTEGDGTENTETSFDQLSGIFATRKDYQRISNALLDVPYSVSALLLRHIHIQGVRSSVSARPMEGTEAPFGTGFSSPGPDAVGTPGISTTPPLPTTTRKRTIYTAGLSSRNLAFNGADTNYGFVLARQESVTLPDQHWVPAGRAQLLRVVDDTKDRFTYRGFNWRLGAHSRSDNVGTITPLLDAAFFEVDELSDVQRVQGYQPLNILLRPEARVANLGAIRSHAAQFNDNADLVCVIEGSPLIIEIGAGSAAYPASDRLTTTFDNGIPDLGYFLPGTSQVINPNPLGSAGQYAVYVGPRANLITYDTYLNGLGWSTNRDNFSRYKQELEFSGNDTDGFVLSRLGHIELV